MTERAFVDTNVWLYAVDRYEPAKQATALDVLAKLSGGRLVTSAQVIGEFFVNATRKLVAPIAPEVASQIIDRMVERIAAQVTVGLDDRIARAAIHGSRRWGISYWDALIIESARAAGCPRVISEDLSDERSYDGVRVENPFIERYRLSESTAAYGDVADRWSDDDLLRQLARYEQACRDAGMRPNAIHSYWDYARRFLAWRTGDYRPRGAPSTGRPVPSGRVTIDGLEDQLARYAGAIKAAGRESVTVDTYQRHASFFLRWLRGDFTPGRRLKRIGRHPTSVAGQQEPIGR